MSLLNQLREDLDTNGGFKLTNDQHLTFSVTKSPTLSEGFKSALKLIAQSIDVNINGLLNMLTTEQIAQVVERHKDVLWQHPEDEGLQAVQLVGITKTLKVWWLEFEYPDTQDAGSFQLHDCKIEDVIGLLESIERVIEPKNTLKS